METTKVTCQSCFKPKAHYHCQICDVSICKNCAHFIDEDYFKYLKNIPKELRFTTYCSACFDQHVSDQLNQYEAMKEEAKNIIIFYKKETKITRLLERKEKPYTVENCIDRDEALQHLSMLAVQDKCNALIDIDLTSHKVDIGTYKKLIWSGRAVPIKLNEKELKQTSQYQDED